MVIAYTSWHWAVAAIVIVVLALAALVVVVAAALLGTNTRDCDNIETGSTHPRKDR